MSWLYLSNPCAFPFRYNRTRFLRVPPAPGFPCALPPEGATIEMENPGENPLRERVFMFL
jgi:hypothetical protein